MKSPLSDVDIPDVPFHELAFETFREFGDEVALVSACVCVCACVCECV